MKSNSYRNLLAYQEFLSDIPWDYMCVFSTDYSLSENSARRLMERLHARLKKMAYANADGLMLFWIAEKFKAKDGYHLHALIKEPPSLKLITEYEINLAFQIVSGARKKGKCFRTDIKKYNPKLNGARYCAKDLIHYSTSYDFII